MPVIENYWQLPFSSTFQSLFSSFCFCILSLRAEKLAVVNNTKPLWQRRRMNLTLKDLTQGHPRIARQSWEVTRQEGKIKNRESSGCLQLCYWGWRQRPLTGRAWDGLPNATSKDRDQHHMRRFAVLIFPRHYGMFGRTQLLPPGKERAKPRLPHAFHPGGGCVPDSASSL